MSRITVLYSTLSVSSSMSFNVVKGHRVTDERCRVRCIYW